MGPFMIKAKKGALAYTLKLPVNWKIHHTFNESLLTPFVPPVFPNQEQPPPPLPDLIEGKEHYEVEKVLNSRQQNIRGRQGEPLRRVTDYFIKWKGYGPESNSWVREEDMDTDELIEEFLTEHIDLIATDKLDTNIIIAEQPDREHWGPREGWQYLVRPGKHPQFRQPAETWYYEHELPQYAKLFDKYWDINWYDKNMEQNSGEEA